MRKFSKVFVLILALVIALSVFAISISAVGDEYTLVIDFGGVISESSVAELPSYSAGDYVEYKDGDFRANYRVTNVSASGKKLTVKLDSEDVRYYAITTPAGEVSYVTKSDVESDLGAKFTNDMMALETGSEIKLLSDVFVSSSSVSLTDKEVYLDLNGFNLVFTNKTVGMGTAFGITNTSFHLYSSRPDGNLFHASPKASHNAETGAITVSNPASYTVFEMKQGAKLFLGAHGNIAGDNLSIYANILANTNGSYLEDEYAITIDGGYYNRYYAGQMAGMFYLRDSSYLSGYFNVSAKNASFNTASRTFYCYSSATSAVGTKQFRIDAENCVFAGGTAADKEPMYQGRMQANFKYCYFLSTPGTSDVVNVGEGCRFASEFNSVLDEGFVFAKSAAQKSLNLKTNNFTFSNYRYDESTGAIYADFDMTSLDVADSFKPYYFGVAAAKIENTSNITWVDLDGGSITERWSNGSIPTATKPLPEGNEIYYYTYGKIVAANGDRTYVARPVAKFGLKVNLTLASDFIYNVYIPESASDSIKEVRVYKSTGEGVILDRGEKATINGVPYYRYFFNIQASLAADAYNFAMDIYTDKVGGKYFTQNCEMSIPAYSAEIIYNDKYSDSTHNLMNKVLAYVKAACDYFKTAGSNEYYSVIGKIPSVVAPTYRAGEKMQEIPQDSDVNGALKGISVIFGSQLKYRYYLDSNIDYSNTSVTFSYTVNGARESVTLTAADIKSDSNGNYYDVALKASDMRANVVLTVNSDSFTYNLSNYIYEVNTESDESAKHLVYALWEYSESASAYSHETPDVDVSINGTPIAEYKIVASTAEEIAAAEIFKSTIAKEHGVELEILSSYDGCAIVFKSVSPESSYDYKANVIDDDLVIECAYRSFFSEGTTRYVHDVFCNSNEDINVTEDRISIYSYGKILYSDFDVPTYNGSAEDFKGLTREEIAAIGAPNAFEALKIAHSVANGKGYDVYGEPGKVYYISENVNASGNAETITIKTNTYWQGASFIIDDSNVSPNVDINISGSHVFTVSSDYSRVRLTDLENEIKAAGGFTKDIKKLNTGLDYPALLLLNNASTTHFIRYTTSTGAPSSVDEFGNPKGQEQHEWVIVDEDGNIDPSTPFLFDYNTVSSIYAYRIDDTPIVLDGGEGCTVTTLSSMVPLAPKEYKNISRNLYVARCNTTVKGIEHVIYNEPTDFGTSGSGKTSGHTYSGFFYVGNTYNVEFNDCVVQSRNCCVEGTYDIGVYNAIDVRFINVTQSNFYEEGKQVPNTGKCWYVMGSNFCKNITYDGCVLTRFDAHCGVYNATIKNSTISSIRLTGGGHFLMENTTVIARRGASQGFIELREDYGSTWDGTIEIKDCTYKNAFGMTADTLYLISAIWVNHDFGYQTYLPNVIVDNLKLASGHDSIKNIEIFRLANGAFSDNSVDTAPDFEENLKNEDYRAEILYDNDGNQKTNANPYIAPDFITIKNNFANKNYQAPSHIVFENTRFKELPLPFDNIDTPVIPYNK